MRTETTAARPLRLNTGRIRDQWHTMTRTARARGSASICRSRSSRFIPTMPLRFGVADGDFARVTTDYGQCTLQRRRQRAPAARHAVRADPLERGQRDRRARRFAGGPVHRSVLGPAREQGDAGIDYALRVRVPRLCAVAHAAELPAHAWCARVAVNGGHGLSVRRQRRSRGLAILAANRSRATTSPNTWISAAGSIARASFGGDRIDDLPVHRARARRRRLECGQGPVCRGYARPTSSAACCCRANRPTALPMPARSSAPALASAATPSAIPSRAARVRRPTSAPKLKAGTNCGSCIPELKRLIAQTGRGDAGQRKLAAAN